MARFMTCTAITDTEDLQTADNWGTGNYKPWYAWNYSNGNFEFIGNDIACYTYVMSVPSGSGEVTKITQPLRFSIIEPTATSGNFEFLKDDSSDAQGGLELAPLASRPINQTFALGTWLPASGDSHAAASDPYRAIMQKLGGGIKAYRCCYHHVGYTLGDWVVSGQNNIPSQVGSPRFYIIGRYVQWRINGTAVGPLHDLKAYRQAANINPTLYDDSNFGRALDHPFPSGSDLWTQYGHLLENWNLEFDAGDLLEIDIWYEIGGLRQTTKNRSVTISFGRYYTNDNQYWQTAYRPTATTGYSLIDGHPLPPYVLELYGIDMSPGFDPATHTYQFDPQDGSFTFGKAQAASAIRFAVTSKSLEWEFHESQASSCGTSLWEWQEDFSTNPTTLKWVLLTNDCTDGGTPVEPNYNPIDIGTQDTTSCQCPVGAGNNWYFFINLIYEHEMVYLRLLGRRETPLASFDLYYRPESSGDYVDVVNDRWEGTIKTGPTGVFNHLGATTFTLFRGPQQTSGAYDASIPSQYSAIASLIPTEILVTKVAQ